MALSAKVKLALKIYYLLQSAWDKQGLSEKARERKLASGFRYIRSLKEKKRRAHESQ